jgi:hypothetical protein
MEQKQADRAQRVNMTDGVPCQSSGVSCGGVTQGKGGSAVGIFMNGYGKKKNRDFYDPLCDI